MGNGRSTRRRKDDGLFGDCGKEPTNRWGALAAVGKHYVDKMGPVGATVVAVVGVTLAALAYVTPGVVHEGLAYWSTQQQADRDHAYRMKRANHTTIVTHTGKTARIDADQQRAVEKDIEGKRELARSLISENIDEPLLRFVAREAETIQPDLLDMAPRWGTLTIDGVPINAPSARQGAKVLRKALRERPSGSWRTTTTVRGV